MRLFELPNRPFIISLVKTRFLLNLTSIKRELLILTQTQITQGEGRNLPVAHMAFAIEITSRVFHVSSTAVLFGGGGGVSRNAPSKVSFPPSKRIVVSVV